jgi:serine/threonine-protein kinase
MSSNLYAAPRANLQAPEADPAIPAEVLKRIRNAWIAGICSGCVTLAITLLAMSGKSVLGYSAWELIDVALIFGLTFGIYKKSRTCAILMLVYFVASKIMLFVDARPSSGIVMAVVFIYFYALGVAGTFQYHRLVRALKVSTS